MVPVWTLIPESSSAIVYLHNYTDTWLLCGAHLKYIACLIDVMHLGSCFIFLFFFHRNVEVYKHCFMINILLESEVLC